MLRCVWACRVHARTRRKKVAPRCIILYVAALHYIAERTMTSGRAVRNEEHVQGRQERMRRTGSMG
eukprot:11575385-Prorocentrum_lima.AAC.1